MAFDKKITPELKEEGKARELMREIQNERRNLGIELTQKVNVSVPWLPIDNEILEYVKNKTLSSEIKKGKFKITKAS